jgi:DNA-binding transcriptional ArsR family regulator
VRSKKATARLDHIFYALSDPTRREILATLARRKANVTELVRRSRLSFPGLSKHLKVLERGELIRRRSDPSDRRAFVFELRPERLEDGALWIERQRRYWRDRFDELEEYVANQYVPKKERPDGARRR